MFWLVVSSFCFGFGVSQIVCVFAYLKPMELRFARLEGKLLRVTKDRDYYADLYSELWCSTVDDTPKEARAKHNFQSFKKPL